MKAKLAKAYLYLNRIPQLQALMYISFKIIVGVCTGKKKKFHFRSGFCSLCGRKSLFYVTEFEKEYIRYATCGSNSRQRFMAYVLKCVFYYLITNPQHKIGNIFHFREYTTKGTRNNGSFKNVQKRIPLKSYVPLLNSTLGDKIYEVDSRGGIHNCIKNYKYYVCSEFFLNKVLGKIFSNIRNENLQVLTFEDNSVGVIISQDVFEHIRDPATAFEEIHRVLKAKGSHVFSVPLKEGSTEELVSKDGEILVLLKKYHSDIIDRDRSLCYHNWGRDITRLLERAGFEVFILENFDLSHMFVEGVNAIFSWKA